MENIVIEITDKTFYDFIDINKQLVVVKFWDPWCGICTEMAPIFESIARRYNEDGKFAGLNMRENKKMADEFEVYITPSFIFFKGGKEISRLGGLLDPADLEAEIKRLL